jgi:hypothetical protein
MGTAMMQGMRMAEMEKSMQLQQERFKQEAANARLLNEERALKIKEQRRQMEGRDRLVQKFMPQTTTKTEMGQPMDYTDTGEQFPSWQDTTTTTQEPPLFTAISKMYGGDKAELARQIMAADPDMGIKMLQGMKPETLDEVGLLSMSANDPRRQNFIQGKQAMQTEKTPTEIALQMRASRGDPEAIRILADMDARKKSLQKERETPEETGSKVKARLTARVQAFTELMGREPTPQEKRAMMINDPYGILGGGEGDTPTSAAPTSKVKGKTVKRTGTDKATGRKVVQYSDGTVAYAD